MPTDTELMNWMEENQGKLSLDDERSGDLYFTPDGNWDHLVVIHSKNGTLRSSLSEAYYRFPLIAKEKADG